MDNLDERIRVVKMSHFGSTYVVPWEERECLLAEMEHAEDGDEFFLSVDTISRSYYENLPEFDGY